MSTSGSFDGERPVSLSADGPRAGGSASSGAHLRTVSVGRPRQSDVSDSAPSRVQRGTPLGLWSRRDFLLTLHHVLDRSSIPRPLCLSFRGKARCSKSQLASYRASGASHALPLPLLCSRFRFSDLLSRKSADRTAN